MRLISLIVRVKLLVAGDGPFIERMRLFARHLHHDGLLHAVRDHFSHHFLAPPLHFYRCCRRFGHYRFSVAVARSRSPRMVLTRAMSLRSLRIFFRLSFWPMFS